MWQINKIPKYLKSRTQQHGYSLLSSEKCLSLSLRSTPFNFVSEEVLLHAWPLSCSAQWKLNARYCLHFTTSKKVPKQTKQVWYFQEGLGRINQSCIVNTDSLRKCFSTCEHTLHSIFFVFAAKRYRVQKVRTDGEEVQTNHEAFKAWVSPTINVKL